MLETESVQSETARNFSRLFNESGYIYESMFKQMGFWRVILKSKNGEINKMQLLSFYRRVGISNLNSVIKQIKLYYALTIYVIYLSLGGMIVIITFNTVKQTSNSYRVIYMFETRSHGDMSHTTAQISIG